MKTHLLIPAAGMGRRLGKDLPKALVPLRGEAMLLATMKRFAFPWIATPVIVLFPRGHESEFRNVLASYPIPVELVEGGEERQDSVKRGLCCIEGDVGLVAIHDAARPFVSPKDIASVVAAAEQHGAATLAMPVADTILVNDGGGFLQNTPDRSLLWSCQTPQVFQVDVIRAAYGWAAENGTLCTDDATLVYRSGHAVKLVRGSASNFKITTGSDLQYADFLMEHGFS